MRISELLAVQAKHISFHRDRVDILLPKSKTNQLREEHIVMIAKTGIFYCPVTWLKKYLNVSGLIHQPESFLLCRFFKVKKVHRASGLKPISYTTTRESFLKFFEPLTKHTGNYGLYSLRSEGVSAVTNYETTDREIRKHGRWSANSSRERYIKDETAKRLRVSKSLNL